MTSDPADPFAAACPPEITRARTLLFVSAGLGVLGLIVSLASLAVIGVAQLVISVVVLLLMWRGPSSRYLSANRG